MTPKEILTAALNRWGSAMQTVVAIEEMAELQKELCKYIRGKGNVEAIAEEIADVYIMLQQMEMLHGIECQVLDWRIAKLMRLEKRLKEEQETAHAPD